MEGAEAAFDFAFGLGARGHEVGHAQRGEGALELRARIAPVGGGLMTEQGQPIGVERDRQAVRAEDAAEVLAVMPSGIGGPKGPGQELAGMIIEREQEGLFIVGRPPLVDRGVVLPEFADPGALPAAAWFGAGRGRTDQEWEVAAGEGGDRFAVAVEGEAGGEFVGDELVIGRALQREEGLEELLHGRRPSGAVVAAGEAQKEGGGVLKPGGAETEEVGATDVQKLGGGVCIELATVESGECLVEELKGEAFGELLFCIVPLSARPARRARLFVDLATLGRLKAWRGGRCMML